MKNQDILQRFLFENIPVRGEVVRLHEAFQEIIQQHPYSPSMQKLLGEALVLVSLLTAIIKFRGRLTLQFQGKGKLKLLLAQCNHDLQVRGLVQADSDITEKELIDAMRTGTLAIMMDPEEGERYQGIVAWKGDSLAESIEGYFTHSEQLPTRIWVAVNETSAAGFLLQKMPREGDHSLSEEHTSADNDWEHLLHLTSTIKEEELLNLAIATLLHRLYFEEDVRLFEAMPVEFRCTCSVQRGENAILLLTLEEVEEELRQNQMLVVTCEFCNREFTYDRVDVARIFHSGRLPPGSTQIH